MEKIEPGKYFDFIYDLYEIEADGSETLRHQVERDEPEHAIFGVTQGFVPALEKALEGLAPGEKFDFTADPDQAFGPYEKDDIVRLPHDVFFVDGKFDAENFTPGTYVPMMTADGFHISGLILEVTDKEVVMDFNHPLSRSRVRFTGEVLAVRDATPEELKPAGYCGCGCSGSCSDGSCGDSACGDGGGCCGCN